MNVAHSKEQLLRYLDQAADVSNDHPVVVSKVWCVWHGVIWHGTIPFVAPMGMFFFAVEGGGSRFVFLGGSGHLVLSFYLRVSASLYLPFS